MKQQDVIEFFDQAAAGWDAQLRRNEPVIARILDNAGQKSILEEIYSSYSDKK